MDENWSWLGRHIAVIVIAVILAVALGSMDLFQTTTVLSKKLSAARIVRFLGYGAVLAVVWLFGQRAALRYPQLEAVSADFVRRCLRCR